MPYLHHHQYKGASVRSEEDKETMLWTRPTFLYTRYHCHMHQQHCNCYQYIHVVVISIFTFALVDPPDLPQLSLDFKKSFNGMKEVQASFYSSLSLILVGSIDWWIYIHPIFYFLDNGWIDFSFSIFVLSSFC